MLWWKFAPEKIGTTATSLFLSGINWRIYPQQVKMGESIKEMILEGGLQKKAVKKSGFHGIQTCSSQILASP